MSDPNPSQRRPFFSRDLFPIYAAIAAASMVVLFNLHRWSSPPDDDPGPPIDKAITGTFTGRRSATPSPQARMETQGAVVGGKLYLLGGYYQTSPKYTGSVRCDAYDPVKNTWQRVANMPIATTHAGIAANSRYIWMAGGYPLRSDGWQNFATTSVYIFDTVNNVWDKTTSLPQARGAGAMVMVGSNLHFLSGVDINRADKTDHWVLNVSVANAKWTTAASVPAPRNHVAAVAYNSKIYVAGGQQGINDAVPVATVYIFDETTGKWTQGANMPRPRSHNSAGAFLYNNRIVVAGGETTNGQALADVIAYDPPTNKWLALPSLPSPRHSPLVQPIGTKIVATDGANPPVIETTTWVSVP